MATMSKMAKMTEMAKMTNMSIMAKMATMAKMAKVYESQHPAHPERRARCELRTAENFSGGSPSGQNKNWKCSMTINPSDFQLVSTGSKKALFDFPDS
jgi:hypothetical protein